MKRSDIWFFGTIVITLVLGILFLIFTNDIPNILTFWWVTLTPYIPIKLFFKETRLFKWLNTVVF